MKAKPKKQKKEFPKHVKVEGIPRLSATIYRQERKKRGTTYTSYVLAYPQLSGELKRQTFADLDEAIEGGQQAIKRMANGQDRVLELGNRDADMYLRASDLIKPLGIDLEAAAREVVDVHAILNGTGSPMEAARFFMKAHSKKLPRISVPKAVEECLASQKADKKSKVRMHQLEFYLNGFADTHNVEVSELTPGIMSRYLTDMMASERTKKNARDVLSWFGRWLLVHGYLDRGTDLLENVQKYKASSGVIHIFMPQELSLLIDKADDRLLPYVVIGAFAGLRGAEIQRLDWSEVDLQDKWITVTAEKSKTNERRLVPIKPNLAAWLKDFAKPSGPVCPFANVVNQLMRLVKAVNKAMPEDTPDKDKLKWKKNALRHSYISYRVAECADAARVADESGNSVQVIRTNYLKRVKPDQAAAWFNIMPAAAIPANVTTIPTAAVATLGAARP